jgi:hypothetical protein
MAFLAAELNLTAFQRIPDNKENHNRAQAAAA